MKKKIILILPTAGGGGSEKVLLNIANLLTYDFNVTVCFLNLNKKDYLHLLNKKIKIINLKKKNIRKSFFQLLKIVNVGKFEYVFSSIFHINIISILIKIFSINNFKLIIRETNKISQKKNNFLKFFLIFIFYRFANLIISPSKKINNELNKFLINKKKIKLLNNPVIINNNKEKKTSQIKKLKSFIKKSKFLITLTRLEKHKNIDFILDCMAKINKTMDLKLLIVGNGTQKFKLNLKIRNLGLQNKVKIISFISNPHIILKKSNLYFNSSYYEGQSNSVLEALYYNVPVLSADNGSHTSYIKKYFYGYVFNRFNVTKVSQKIPQIINKKFSKINPKYYQDVDGTKIKKKLVKIINKIN